MTTEDTGGGFGAGEAPGPDAPTQADFMGTPILTPTPDGEEAPVAEQPWHSGLNEEQIAYMKGKGFLHGDPQATVAATVEAQRRSEAEMHKALQRAAELEDAFAEADLGGGQQQPLPMGEDGLGLRLAQYQRAVQEGLPPEDGMPVLFEAMLEEVDRRVSAQTSAIEQKLTNEHIAPLENERWTGHWNSESQALQSELGQESYREVAPRAKAIVAQMVRENPGTKQWKGAMRAAFGQALQEKMVADRRADQAQTLNGGASAGGAPRGNTPNPADAILADMDEFAAGNMSGGFGE